MRKTIICIVIVAILLSTINPCFTIRVVASENDANGEVMHLIRTESDEDVPPEIDNPDPPVLYIYVDDIDIADVRSPMTVGTSQTLGVTVIPINATDRTIIYRSRTPRIASVNALGRITAIAPGAATIEISAGWITRTISFVVEAKEEVRVTSIDLDYEDTMTVGTSQTILHSVLPREADYKVKYSSNNIRVATVNDFGRITAHSAGKVTITITAEDVTKAIIVTIKDEIEATEIDLGDVKTDMTIGTSQLLNVSIFPFDTVDRTTVYMSSNDSILTVNPFGRVTAVGIGRADVTVSVGSVRRMISIDVSDEIVPTDIDFDIKETKINVNSTVNIGATVLPTDVYDRSIIYTSSDTSILTVNELGRVRGVNLGTATITLQAGTITKSIDFTVVEEDVVTTIDVREFQEKMKIDDTQEIYLNLHPKNATDQTVLYLSSNPGIAKVSEGGLITAVGRGTVTITISAGMAVEELKITVYVATDRIDVPESYLIMQPTNTHRVFASVSPRNADQHLSYESTNEHVVSVSANGTITAHSSGRASIIISNYDSTKAITVIVNEGSVSSTNVIEASTQSLIQNQSYSQMLVAMIQNSNDGDLITVNGAQYPLITTDALRALFGTSKSINIFFDDYIIRMRGTDIRNAENELITDISLSRNDLSISFTVNGERNLPGSIEIEFLDLSSDYRNLFLINDSTNHLDRLNSLNGAIATISLAGKYILSAIDNKGISFEIYIVIVFSILICVCVAIYIIICKRYWFW